MLTPPLRAAAVDRSHRKLRALPLRSEKALLDRTLLGGPEHVARAAQIAHAIEGHIDHAQRRARRDQMEEAL
jgi:hypothetical protein